MLPGIVGQITPFDPNVCKFSTYVARFRQFITLNNVPEAKRVATFLTCIGDAHFQLLVNLLAPDDPATKTVDELVQALQAHFEPPVLEVAERQKFYARRQRENETISALAADLKRLSLTCNFNAAVLDETLRDQLVTAVRSQATKHRLVTTANLTFNRAVQISQQYEATDRELASVLHHPAANSTSASSTSATVSTVQSKKQHSKFGKKKNWKGNNGTSPPVSTTKPNPSKKPHSKGSCHRCGKPDHWAPDCPHIGAQCHKCGKKGHLASVCRGKASVSTIGDIGCIFHSSSPPDSIKISVLVNSKPIAMELDTGASYSLLSEEHWKEVGSPKLASTNIALRAYGSANGHKLRILGTFNANVVVHGTMATVPLLVVRAPNFPSLFGRDWISKFRLDWSSLLRTVLPNATINSITLNDVTSKFPDLFDSGLGHITGVRAHIEMRPDATPRFHKPRTLPFMLKPKVDSALDKLESMGVIKPILRSDWAAPIVPVLKPDGTVRICGDFRLTINPSIQADWYPLPSTEELFASLAGAKVFSKLDLSDAYLQIELEETAKQYVVINTHRGLYAYNRLPFGVSFAPGLFQHTIEKITQNLAGVNCYMDDAIVYGRDQQEHDQRLIALLTRFREHGVRLKKSKCEISKQSLLYLGHVISDGCILPSKEKVRAILEAPKPTNITELRSFLSLVSYYGKFIGDLSTAASPLYALLQKSAKWNWTKSCENSFNSLRRAITADSVLIAYSSELPLVLECDASPTGIGCALSHVTVEGTRRPIAFASKTLTASEKNYSQIEREGLALVFGVKKFHRYLFGRKFILVTDHKPLLMVMGPKGHIASVSSSRLHRWAVILSAYDFNLEFRPTEKHANVDYLSRFSLPDTTDPCLDSSVVNDINSIMFLDDISGSPLTYKQVRAATIKDSLLTEVIRYVQSGWPFENHCSNPALQPFFSRRQELSVSGGCLLWNLRLIIPDSLRSQILQSLHECHSGIVRMKAIARSYIWWPGIDSQIEEIAKSCTSCAQIQAAPGKAPLHPWAYPERPWQRVHVDFCGPLFNHQWLVLVDAHSKWPEVIPFTGPPTSSTLIDALRTIFARFGLCEEIVSDNGPQFTSQQFQTFCANSGIRHRLTAPYQPATNGEAERFVRSFKEGLKSFGSEGDWKYNVQRFLLAYRVTPHSTTGRTPSELMLGRTIRSTWDLLRPTVTDSVDSAQKRQISAHGGKERSFQIGDFVWVRDYRGSDKWAPGEIVHVFGPRNYRVRTSIGTWKRHVEQMRSRLPNSLPDSDFQPDLVPLLPTPTSVPQLAPPAPVPEIPADDLIPHTPDLPASPATPLARRYPQRIRQQPDRFIP